MLLILNGKGYAQVLEASQWAADVDYETTQTGVKLRLHCGDLRRLLGRPFVELLLSDGSRYELLLPSPPADVTFYALIIKQLRPINFVR